MNRLWMTLLLLLMGMLGGAALYMAHLHSEQIALQRTNAQLTTGMIQRDEVITQLQGEIARQAEAERTLRQSLLSARDLTMKQQLNDQRIIRSNEALQRWSDAALPDGIIRLQQHPAFATPKDYLAWLSDRQQLFDPGQSAGNTGGSAEHDPPAGAGTADVRPASRNP